MPLLPISNHTSFWEEARYQRVCAVCGRVGGTPDIRGRRWHAHHVVPRELLRRLNQPEWDTRNALRLCTDCHMAFEWAGPGKIAVPVARLRGENICFAWEVLGVTVGQIEKKSGDFTQDPRWEKHRREECELCQRTS